MDKARTRFVPIVLSTILSYMQPADLVVAQTVNWQLWSACMHLLSLLAKPKRGMLILKWPLFGTDAVWLQRFYGQISLTTSASLDLIQYKKAMDAEIIKFFMGMESLVLNAVTVTKLDSYLNLSVFMLDLRVPAFASAKYYTNTDIIRWFETIAPRVANYARFRSARLQTSASATAADGRYLLFNSRLWTQAIATVVDQCAPNLQHFLFLTDSHETHTNRKVYPDEFWTDLGLDRMLSNMKALQTLYLPTLEPYESTFRKRKQSVQQAWQALHALPLQERLPNLRRVMIDKYSSFVGSGATNAAMRTPTCGLPDFPISPHNLIVIPYGRANAIDVNEQISHQNMVFPQDNSLLDRVKKLRFNSSLLLTREIPFTYFADVDFAEDYFKRCGEILSNRQCMFSVWHDIRRRGDVDNSKAEQVCLQLFLVKLDINDARARMLDAVVMQQYRQKNVRMHFMPQLTNQAGENDPSVFRHVLDINREGERCHFNNDDRLELVCNGHFDDWLQVSLRNGWAVGPDRELTNLPKITLTLNRVQNVEFSLSTSVIDILKFIENIVMDDMRELAKGIVDAKKSQPVFKKLRLSLYNKVQRIKYRCSIGFKLCADVAKWSMQRAVVRRVEEAFDSRNDQFVQKILCNVFGVSDSDEGVDDVKQWLLPSLKWLTVEVCLRVQ